MPQVQELQYDRMLNRVLPDDIRVLGWAPVHPDFSARCPAACFVGALQRWRPHGSTVQVQLQRAHLPLHLCAQNAGH